MNNNLLMFSNFTLLTLTILGALSSSSMISVWMFMEINMMTFLGLLLTTKKDQSSAAIKYFIVQSLGSSMLMISLLLHNLDTPASMVMILGITLKLGMSPFHSWFIHLSRTMTWTTLFIFLTMQKIIPLFAMMSFQVKAPWALIILSVMFSCLGSTMETEIKPLMALSSLFNSVWWILTNQWDTFMMFFMIYSMNLMIMVLIMKNLMLNSQQEANTQKMDTKTTITAAANLLSISGLPPFPMFFAKTYLTMFMMNSMETLTTILLLLMSSMYMTFMYIRMMFMGTMMNKKEMLYSTHTTKNMMMQLFMLSFTPMMFL